MAWKNSVKDQRPGNPGLYNSHRDFHVQHSMNAFFPNLTENQPEDKCVLYILVYGHYFSVQYSI